MLKVFFLSFVSVNFGRSTYSLWRSTSGIIKKTLLMENLNVF